MLKIKVEKCKFILLHKEHFLKFSAKSEHVLALVVKGLKSSQTELIRKFTNKLQNQSPELKNNRTILFSRRSHPERRNGEHQQQRPRAVRGRAGLR